MTAPYGNVDLLLGRTRRHMTCPHCDTRTPAPAMALHLADTGNLRVRPDWACPVLWSKRRHPSNHRKGS